MLAVLAADSRGGLGLLRTRLAEDLRYPALSTELPQAQAFERELLEEHGIQPEGHPWAKPLRRHSDLEPRGRRDRRGRPSAILSSASKDRESTKSPWDPSTPESSSRVTFASSATGETVLHLEIQLGYQHRGAEALLLRSSPARRLVVAESIAGDTSIGHGLAYCMVVEALADVEPPLDAHAVRGVALELERVSNHVGDLDPSATTSDICPALRGSGAFAASFEPASGAIR